MVPDRTLVDSFTDFVTESEPRLKQALCATLGREAGLEAAAEALAFAWEHWDRVEGLESPIGYLYGVGRNKARAWGRRAQRRHLPAPPASHVPRVEPRLAKALGHLSDRQRIVVMLVHCFDWTYSEAAELLGVSKSTVQQHAERGLGKLRRAIGAENE